MLKRIDIRKLIVRLILICLLIGVLGTILFDRVIKRYGYDGAGDFVTNYWKNSFNRVDVEPLTMNISISDEGVDFLSSKRDEALERGIQINEGNNYVECDVTVDGEQSTGQIRLKGHMTDHLEGDKWSYRVKTDNPVLGMNRFSLQHPGTRNYAYEWVYHQFLANEDVIHLYYDFIELKINEDSKGIYALEEHFGQHILERNDRPKGAILRWNPELYWANRINMSDGIYIDEQYSDFSSSYAEPYDKGVVKNDPELVKTYQKCAAMLEGFRRDSLSAEEVFDLDKLARFHAVIDLVGGHHSLDWSDIKFYYNSNTKLVEPVGYESFSVRKSERIAGQINPDGSTEEILDYHDKLFSDITFYRLYIQHLERIADEKYLNDFIKSIQSDLDQKLSILAIEWPYRKFSFDPYFKNVELIRSNLDLPKPLHSFVDSVSTDSIYISVAPVSDFPIEITKVELNGKEKVKVNELIIPSKKRNTFAQYCHFTVPNTVGKLKKLELHCKIPGSSNKFKIEVNEYPSYSFHLNLSSFETTDIREHPQLAFNSSLNTYYFTSSEINVDKDYLIPEELSVQISAGQQVNYTNGGSFVVHGNLELDGLEDELIVMHSESSDPMIYLKHGKIDLNYVQVVGTSKILEAEEGHCQVKNSVFAVNQEYLFSALNSTVEISNTSVGNIRGLGDFERSTLVLDNLVAINIDTLILSSGTNIRIKESIFRDMKEMVELNHLSSLRSTGSQYTNVDVLASLNNASDIFHGNDQIRKSGIGFVLDKETSLSKPSSYQLYKSKVELKKEVEN